MSPVVRLVADVTGDVQGVGFRAFTERRARGFGVTGSVANLPDGRVHVVAEGPRSACGQLLDALRSAASPGRVASVDETWTDVTAEDRATGFAAR